MILTVCLILALVPVGMAQSSRSTNAVTTAGTLKDLTTPPSYYQQLRDIEKDQTDRIINEKIKKYMEAPKKERKAREAQNKLESLQAEELALERKKAELEKLEEKDQLQQQILAKYLKRIQEESVATNKTVSDKLRNVEPQKIQTAAQPRPVQEAMKAEPPQ